MPITNRRASRLRLLAWFVAALLSSSAHGVVIDSGDGTGNTTPPADDFGFENVGSASGLSGIYLGGGWVLTANHVGAVGARLRAMQS
jgi:hypothetical protein